MIEVSNVHKVYETRFGKNHVLNDISFTLRKGEKLGILGRNGAGKSTLVRLVSGAELPTSGQIDRRMSVSWPLAFGGAFQTTLTGQDNVRFISRIYEQDFEKNLAFVEEFAELGEYLKEPVRTYSSGMRARLAFAISMITEFDCFLIDEVGAVGDARFHDKCNHELFEKRADRAMIIISHDASYVRDHCNRYAVLHDSRLSLYDDFDVAYGDYANLISLSKKGATSSKTVVDRSSALDVIYRAAISDERFRIHVQRGDWARNKGDWKVAEAEYSAALALYPYERTYWSQLGHALRARKDYIRAEIAYRNSCALGQPVLDVRPFLRDVMAHQGVDEKQFPIWSSRKGDLSKQPPASRDISVLLRAFWGLAAPESAQVLDLMRTNETLDDLVFALVTDPAAPALLNTLQGERDGGSVPTFTKEEADWAFTLCQIARPRLNYDDREATIANFRNANEVLESIIAAGGFSGWKKSEAALRQLYSSS